MKSIINQEEGTCYLCEIFGINRRYAYLEEHHIFFGRSNSKKNGARGKSEKYGLKVNLCVTHHRTGEDAVHKNREICDGLRRIAQKVFELNYSHEAFMKEFGKNYL